MFNQYPYVNENDLNLDYVLASIKKLKEIMDEFVTLNTITFADPIVWDITTQYAKNTVVLDTNGNAYLSLVAVPAGVQLNNGDYWLEIFNFTDYTRTANQNLTVNVETNTTRATAAYNVDDWLIWNDVLYKVTSAIAIDDALIVAPDAGANIIHFTVEDFIKAFMTWATNTIQQYKNEIDASELAYRQQLAQDIANTTASLQAQLNAAIAGATVDSEVINARVGWDNVTYNTLRDAITTQILQAFNQSLSFVGFDQDSQASYDITTHILTLNATFYEKNGHGVGGAISTTIDITGISPENAVILWIREDKTLYAKNWGAYADNNTDKMIGYIYGRVVWIAGVMDRNITILNNGKEYVRNDSYRGSYIVPGTEISFDAATKILTIGAGYRVYRGAGMGVGASTLDVSSVIEDNAFILFMRKDRSIYAARWRYTPHESGDDELIGRYYAPYLYINGVYESQLIVKNITGGALVPNSPPMLGYNTNDGEKIVFNYDTGILTIPTNIFYCQSGRSLGYNAQSIDLSSALGATKACKLFIRSNGQIYGTSWNGGNASEAADQQIGYIYRYTVYIAGVNEKDIVTRGTANHILCLGDSITAGTGYNVPYFTRWSNKLARFAFKNYGYGGSGYAYSANNVTAFVGSGEEGKGVSMTATAPNTISDILDNIVSVPLYGITIFSGTNDWGNNIPLSTFRLAVQTALDKALSRTQKILVITPIRREGNTNVLGLTLEDYCDIIIEECISRGIAYYNGYDVSINPNSTYSKNRLCPDGLHPNDNGHIRIAEATYNKLLEIL